MSTRECPYCAEEIKEEAIKCKHCGSVMPEAQQKAEEAEMEAQVAEERAVQVMTVEYAKKMINIGYLFIFLGLLAGVGIMIYGDLSWYAIPITGYALWSLYWGAQIIHRPVKHFYDNLFIFGSGVVDLFVKQIGLRLGMYLLAIPIIGLIVGALGGALFKQIQYSKIKGKYYENA